MKWVRASARIFCGRRLAERDAGYSLKGVKSPPPQGQNSYFLLRSPNLAKPWADQRLDPPALLTAMDAPLTFGMIGNFPLRIAEEIPIPVSIQILTSCLVFQGGLPPVFRRIFALCPAFQRRVGYLPYPRGKGGTQGRQRLLLFFTAVGGMCFTSVFSAATANSAGTATVFHFFFQMHSSCTSEAEKCISDAGCACATPLPRKKKC